MGVWHRLLATAAPSLVRVFICADNGIAAATYTHATQTTQPTNQPICRAAVARLDANTSTGLAWYRELYNLRKLIVDFSTSTVTYLLILLTDSCSNVGAAVWRRIRH